ncbi:hypothetical protein [Phyllobacterium sp. K27]
MSKKPKHDPVHFVEITVVKDQHRQSVVVRPEQINGVYLRLINRTDDRETDTFCVTVSVNKQEYEIGCELRESAFKVARKVADLALLAAIPATISPLD